LTGQRRGEIAGLRRSWITEDTITFPMGFVKNKREHKIPIGLLMKKLLEEMPSETDLFFPRGASASNHSMAGPKQSEILIGLSELHLTHCTICAAPVVQTSRGQGCPFMSLSSC